MAYREIVQKFKNLVSQLNDTIKFNFFLQMQFYLHNYFDEIGNNTDDSHEEYIQKILELYINTCQRIRFESMSSRKLCSIIHYLDVGEKGCKFYLSRRQ